MHYRQLMIFAILCGGILYTVPSWAAKPSGVAESTAPSLKKAVPLKVFPEDVVSVSGENLGGDNYTVMWGNIALKAQRKHATEFLFTVPPEAKTGKLTLVYNGKKKVLRTKIKVQKPPVIDSVTTCVAPQGVVTIKGSNLNFVTRWWSASSAEVKVLSVSKKKVRLKILSDRVRRIRIRGEYGTGIRIESPTLLNTVEPPRIDTLFYASTGNPDAPFMGKIYGENLESCINVKIGKEVLDMDRDGSYKKHRQFTFQKKLPKKMLKVTYANGDVKGTKFSYDGKKEGFVYSEKEIVEALFSNSFTMPEDSVVAEFQILENNLEIIGNLLKNRKKGSLGAETKFISETTSQLLLLLKRVRVLQSAFCQQMGTATNGSGGISIHGRRLKKVTALLHEYSEAPLLALWSGTDANLLKKKHKKLGLKKIAQSLNDLVESRHTVWRACHEKRFGDGSSSVDDVVRREIEQTYWRAFVSMFSDLITQTPDKKRFEKQLKKMLKPLEKEQRDFWTQQVLAEYDRVHIPTK